ncbi:uncharacterized protein LOC135698804 [Ochlerotatus camptorhynchus]|uniref:uncharacterized protein LOC135698804 n=1 Tax=Ochlerotatus camptorhynchus TaxID=644619 RepID=UPI0031E113CE
MEALSYCSINLELDASDADYAAEFLDEDDPIGNIDKFPDYDETEPAEPEQEPEADHPSSVLPVPKRKRLEECTFHLIISCYKKDFRGQHHDKGKADAKVITRECHVFGNSPEEVLEQTWEAIRSHTRSHIRREVTVYDDQSLKRVKWTEGADPEEDMDKFVLFKDLQRKRTYRVSDLQEKPDVMIRWRCKVIDVYLHVYSLAVANPKLYDLVQRVEAPDDPDRSGACSNKSFQGLINELKRMHPEVSANSFVWNNWAEHVEAAPGYKRDDVKLNPPDDIQSHLRPPPNDDSAILEENRRELFFAKTIICAMEVHIQELREQSIHLTAAAKKIEERVSGMEIQLKSYNEMLTSMQRSLAPVENELSRALANSVTAAEDVDHM